MPPRTANSPRRSTRSVREYAAAARSSTTRSSGASAPAERATGRSSPRPLEIGWSRARTGATTTANGPWESSPGSGWARRRRTESRCPTVSLRGLSRSCGRVSQEGKSPTTPGPEAPLQGRVEVLRLTSCRRDRQHRGASRARRQCGDDEVASARRRCGTDLGAGDGKALPQARGAWERGDARPQGGERRHSGDSSGGAQPLRLGGARPDRQIRRGSAKRRRAGATGGPTSRPSVVPADTAFA